MTSLNVYGSNVASGTLSTAGEMSTTTGGAQGFISNGPSTGTPTGWFELSPMGLQAQNSPPGSIPSPTGNGTLLDSTLLEGNTIAAGTWTAYFKFAMTGSSATIPTLTIRFYKRSSGGTYTSIGSLSLSNQNLSLSLLSYTFSGSMPSVSFAAGDKLYVDAFANCALSSSNLILVSYSTSGTAGIAINWEVDTPGYSLTPNFRDVTVRGKVSATGYKDITVRGRISATIQKDITTRGNVSATIHKGVTVRGIISAGIASGGFTLFANGTGTATYDSFRVTQYPDPALSLYNVGRAGSSYVGWDAILPNSNTALGVDTSIDGFTWSDVSNQNGGAIPGIFAQPDPTIDGFGSNSATNYTSTFRTNGAAATWTYDTTNSRLVATGGTNGLYIYNGINNADIAMIADLDQADAGGLVFDYIDQSDFYLLSVADSQASVGTPNTMTLYKVASNVQTQLATASIAWTRGVWKRFKVQMASGVITAYFDGTQVFTYTDNSPLGAGNPGLYNNGGTVGSRYYQLWMQPLGQYVSGTPFGDIVTAKFVYTRERLATSNSSYTPQVLDLTTVVYDPKIMPGVTVPAISYKNNFISKAHDDLAKQSDYTWHIDDSGNLFFRARQVNPSPWILQSSSLVPQSDLEVDSNFYVETKADLYRNRQVVLGATDTGNFSETHVGDSHTRSFTLGYPLAATPSAFTLNGVPQTLAVKGSTGANFYYAIGDSVITQDSSLTLLTSSDTIALTYLGSFPVTVTVDNVAAQQAMAAVQGGTGIVEAVEDRTGQGLNKAAALTLAAQLLARYCINGRTIQFLTARDGLDIGQYLTVFLPEHGIWDGQFQVQNVQITLQTQPGNKVIYWYLVQASQLPNQGSWAKLMASSLLLQ